MEWYPKQSKDLNNILVKLLKDDFPKQEIHGIIVPHAGYSYSGAIAGKAFCYLKNSNLKKAIILAPSHYIGLRGLAKHNKDYWETPLGKIKIFDERIRAKEIDIKEEHAIGNQIPFLQKIGFQEIFPLMIGSITIQESKKIAEDLSNEKKIFIISADLSHFLEYKEAIEKDKKTIEAIQNLDFNKIGQIDSCGLFPIIIAMNLCKINKWQPKLIEYKNSGDITGDKTSVVGYASFWF
jgi:MEMO1 family protein